MDAKNKWSVSCLLGPPPIYTKHARTMDAKNKWSKVRKLIRLEIKRHLSERKKVKALEELSQDEKSAQIKANQADIESRKVALAAAQKKLKATQSAPTDL